MLSTVSIYIRFGSFNSSILHLYFERDSPKETAKLHTDYCSTDESSGDELDDELDDHDDDEAELEEELFVALLVVDSESESSDESLEDELDDDDDELESSFLLIVAVWAVRDDEGVIGGDDLRSINSMLVIASTETASDESLEDLLDDDDDDDGMVLEL